MTTLLKSPGIVRPKLLIVGLLWVSGWVVTLMVYPSSLSWLIPIVYAGILLGFFVAVSCLEKPGLAILSPSFLTIAYTCTSFAVGAWAYQTGHILSQLDLIDYARWSNYRYAALYFAFGMLFIFLLFIFQSSDMQLNFVLDTRFNRFSLWTWLRLIFLFVFFTRVNIRFNILGGEGSFSFIILTLLAIRVGYEFRDRPQIVRIGVYILLLGIFATIGFRNKREAILMFLALVTLDFVAVQEPIGRRVVAVVVLASVSLVAILSMSILRGYGGLEARSFLAAVRKLPTYLSNKFFISMMMNNIEASYSFFNSHQAIEYIATNEANISFGSTLSKVLFIWLPRSLAPWKPVSMITLYTLERDPSFRELGGSWPIHLLSELHWNFGIVGLLMVFPIFGLANRTYWRMVKNVRSGRRMEAWRVFALVYFMAYVRGSGLDLYVIYIILAYIFDRYLIRFIVTATLKTRICNTIALKPRVGL